MEQKNIKHRNFLNLLLNGLKEKRNWFILSMAILITTVLIVPMLIGTKINEANIVVGVIEVFIIVFLNCIIDLSYLHDIKKYSFYLSKPNSEKDKINLFLVSNIVFALINMIPLWILSIIMKFDTVEIFTIAFPWLIIGIFVAALSGVLSGNSISAGIDTIFNFILPLLLLGVIYFALNIVEKVVIGFNTDILMENFISNIYRIDYLYFIKFVEDSNWLLYGILFLLIPSIIYLLTMKLLKKRKNEKIGEFIVYDGHKNFIALLVSTLIPFLFSTVTRNSSVFGLLFSFLILGSLTYYVAMAILEKSFKLNKKSFKLLAIFMAIFIGFVFIGGLVTKQYENKIPNIDEIEGVIISNDSGIYIEEMEEYVKFYDIELSFEKYDGIVIYKSEEAKKAIVDIHKAILENDSYERYDNVNIVYFLKDGSEFKRYYRLGENRYYEPDHSKEEREIIINDKLNNAANKLVSTDEFKEKVLRFIYNDSYSADFNNAKITINGNESELTKEDIVNFRNVLKKDIEKNIIGKDLIMIYVLVNNTENYLNQYSYNMEKYDAEYRESYRERMNIEFDQGSKERHYYNIPNSFNNTMEFLKKF
ncbi:hypothetical protein QUF55_01615 [Clostridiaceae bacterium HSG29]|nr:hypothetical protein [Clostridiaceae bacterium HSG29]